MKHWYIFLILALLTPNAFGQIDYIAIDSAKIGGIELINGGGKDNSRICQVKKGDRIIVYSPFEVQEFGFQNGQSYESFPITLGDTISQFFLEQLSKGKVNLYYLSLKGNIKKFYLIQEDSTNLIEIPQRKAEFHDFLELIVNDCPQAIKNTPFVSYRKYSLQRFIRDYNHCVNRPLPRPRFGFTVGITATHLSPVLNASFYSPSVNHNNDWNISIGPSMDIPIRSSSLSFHPEVYYQHNTISVYIDDQPTDRDLIIKYSKITMPLQFRYSIISKKKIPYFQLGPVFSRTFKNECTQYIYYTTYNSYSHRENVFISFENSPVLKKNMLGISTGCGLIFQYGSKLSYFGEIRYSKLYNLGSENILLNFSDFNFNLGILF
jgi:hypothetical protein